MHCFSFLFYALNAVLTLTLLPDLLILLCSSSPPIATPLLHRNAIRAVLLFPLTDPPQINLPTGGAALLLLIFSLKRNPHTRMTFAEFFRTFNFLGLFLIMSSVICLLVGFNFGETDWSRKETIVLLVLGVVTLLAAVFVEIKTTRSPIIPPRLFKVSSSRSIRS